MKALARYQIILLGEQRHIGVNNLPKVVARQCSGCMGVEPTTRTVSPSRADQGVWGSVIATPVGFGAEPQPKMGFGVF